MIIDQTGPFGISISFSSSSLIVKKEAYVYPFTSFVAEFGGSLGLFLGFSFYGFWDIIIGVAKASKINFKKIILKI